MSGTSVVYVKGIRFRSILVDLDNTLYDFAHAKKMACNCVIEYIGVGDTNELMESFLFSPHGVENVQVIHDYLEKYGISDKNIISGVTEKYIQVKQSSILAYPGVLETFHRINSLGLKIGAITNASTEHALNRLSKIEVLDFIECLVTPDNSGYKKPDPRMFMHALELLNLEPCQTIMIGDNLVNDIRPAMQVGMCTVHAEYGNHLPLKYSEGIIPDYTISSFTDILRIVDM